MLMIIDDKILDELSAKAKASPRLRMNYNFILLRGKLRVTTYNDDGTVIESIVLNPREGRYGVKFSHN